MTAPINPLLVKFWNKYQKMNGVLITRTISPYRYDFMTSWVKKMASKNATKNKRKLFSSSTFWSFFLWDYKMG